LQLKTPQPAWLDDLALDSTPVKSPMVVAASLASAHNSLQATVKETAAFRRFHSVLERAE
jgi:hypothetical protein